MSEQACMVQVSGRVQQVGFRMWICHQAGQLGIRGWVRNLPDGRVEACLVGPAGELERMIGSLRQGPPLARVDALERTDMAPPQGIDGFAIL
jgi:acylphosphatase